MALQLSDTMRFREEDFGGILFRKEDNFFIQVNKSGYRLIDSFQDKAEIEKAKEKYPEFIDFAARLRVLQEGANVAESSIGHNRTSAIIHPSERRLREGFLRSPLEVGIEITSRCQLRCVHCYGAFNDAGHNGELNEKEIYGIVDQLDALGTFAIFVGGGEPTLHPSFFDICKHILQKDMNVVVSTNGMTIDEKVAQSFADLGGYVGVQVSLEGPNEEINDAMRGRGSLKSAVRGLKNLQNAGMNPTIGTTITSVNHRSLDEMIAYARDLGVPHIHFMCLMPSGRGDTLYEKLKLTGDQRIRITRQIRELKEKYKGSIGLDCANFYQQPPSRDFDPTTAYDKIDKIFAGCEASRVKAVITSSGDVVGCEIIRNNVAGNVREKPFLEIWENSEVFSMIRGRNAKSIQGKCPSCKYVVACAGDCPAYSLYHNKPFKAGGEECPHEPEKSLYHLLD